MPRLRKCTKLFFNHYLNAFWTDMTSQDCPVSCSETVSCSISHHLYCSILQTKQGKITVSCSARHYLYCSILQIKQGKFTVSCSVSHIFYSRLSPKMAFLISFSWSKTKRATMALSSAVEGSLMLDADFKRSRTLFRSESIYTVASLESRAL